MSDYTIHEIKAVLYGIHDILERYGKVISSERIEKNLVEEVIAFKDDKEGAVFKTVYDTSSAECKAITWDKAMVSIDKSSPYTDIMVGGSFSAREEG